MLRGGYLVTMYSTVKVNICAKPSVYRRYKQTSLSAYEPSAGALTTSSLINFVTSLSRTTESSAQPLWARVSSCRMAVRKPCGLKKPVIQQTFGRPSNNQPLSWALRSNRSVYQNPRVADSHDICIHQCCVSDKYHAIKKPLVLCHLRILDRLLGWLT